MFKIVIFHIEQDRLYYKTYFYLVGQYKKI